MGSRDLGAPAPRTAVERSAAAWAALFALLFGLAVAALLRPARAGGEGLFSRSDDLLPFVSLAAGKISALLAVLAVACAAVAVTLVLQRRLGVPAPLWVAAFVFASVAAPAALWTPAAAILMAAVALAFALAQGGRAPAGAPPEIWDDGGAARGVGGVARWLAIGALLGLAGAAQPLDLGLLIPAALMAPELGRKKARLALVGGAAVVVAAGLLLGGSGAWISRALPPVFDLKLAGWNVIYLITGRNVGLLVGFLPLLLAFGGADEERGRVALGVTVVLLAVGFVLVRPFDFFGGPAAIGNRLFLPLYGAAWLCAAKPARHWPPLAVAVLAAVGLWPIWVHPLSPPIDSEGQPRFSSLVRRLPFEMTQRELPAAHDVVHHGLRTRFPGPDLWPAAHGESLRLAAASGEVVFAAPTALGSMLLELGPAATPRLSVDGGSLGEMILRPDGGIAYVITFEKPRAVMPGWWSDAPVYWYRLRLVFPEAPPAPISLSLEPQRKPERG